MSTVLPISTKWTIRNLWPQIIGHEKRQRQTTLEIQVLVWNMLKNVAELNPLIGPVVFIGRYMEKVFISLRVNCISGVMVSVLASSAVDRMFDPRSGKTKDCKIGICCFSAKHAALRRKSKDWLARNQDNVSEWGDMSIHGLLFQWASIIKYLTKHVDLVQSEPHHRFIEN